MTIKTMAQLMGENANLKRRLQYCYLIIEGGFASGVFDFSTLRNEAINFLRNNYDPSESNDHADDGF